MASTTLAYDRTKFRGAIGHYLGYGRGTDLGDAEWPDKQEADIDFCLDAGLDRFYHPPVNADGVSHAWSFLRPVRSLTLASGSAYLKLPDDFGGLEGDIVVSTSSGTFRTMPVVADVVTMHAQQPDTTGPPQYAALEPNKSDGVGEQQWRLHVFPTSDAAYTLQMTYHVSADALKADRPHAYGGAQHGGTILASCLAAAEMFLDNAKGVQWQDFMERLAVSISLDTRTKAQHLGHVGHRELNTDDRRRRWGWPAVVTVAGVEYS